MPPLSPPLPPGQYVDLPGRGRTFARVSEGAPGAPAVLLLHGWTASADLNWFRCYEPLRRAGYTVVAIDHRGHGRGIRSPLRPFSIGDCADDAAALLHELGIPRAIVVGYSMGGPVAQVLWKRHPEMVDGLVLCATSRNFGRSLPERAMFTSLLGLSGVARVTPGVVRRQVAERILGTRLDGTPIGQWIATELQRNDPATVLQAGWSIGRFSSANWIGDVDVPTVVVVTTHDSVVSPARQLRLAAAVPGAEVIKVNGDHGVCVADPHRFVPALLQAVQRVKAASTSRAAATTAAE